MLERRHYQATRKALQKGKSWVQCSTVWDEIVDHMGIGCRHKGGYRISEPEWRKLRCALERDTGRDPMTEHLGGDRMTQVGYAPNEKLAKQGVFERPVLVSSIGGVPIPIRDGAFQIPGSIDFIGLSGEQIDQEELANRHLVVIENGTLITYRDDLALPPPFNQSVLVYRGHGIGAQAVRNLVIGHPHERLAFFYDFDPAGLSMASNAGKGSAIIPSDWRSMTKESKGNKPSAFHAQQDQLYSALGNRCSPDMTAVLSHMANHQIAVTQEALVHHRVRLKSIPMVAGKKK